MLSARPAAQSLVNYVKMQPVNWEWARAESRVPMANYLSVILLEFVHHVFRFFLRTEIPAHHPGSAHQNPRVLDLRWRHFGSAAHCGRGAAPRHRLRSDDPRLLAHGVFMQHR